jgi:predicted neutral ceramidase superfamily lipid hydrolase
VFIISSFILMTCLSALVTTVTHCVVYSIRDREYNSTGLRLRRYFGRTETIVKVEGGENLLRSFFDSVPCTVTPDIEHNLFEFLALNDIKNLYTKPGHGSMSHYRNLFHILHHHLTLLGVN